MEWMGNVSASGSFSGTLQHILKPRGTTDVPAFSVRSSGHRVHVVGRYRAIVIGLNGDTELSPAVTHFGKTTIAWSGTIAGTSDQSSGKTVSSRRNLRQRPYSGFTVVVCAVGTPPMSGLRYPHFHQTSPVDQPFLNRVQVWRETFRNYGAQYPTRRRKNR